MNGVSKGVVGAAVLVVAVLGVLVLGQRSDLRDARDRLADLEREAAANAAARSELATLRTELSTLETKLASLEDAASATPRVAKRALDSADAAGAANEVAAGDIVASLTSDDAAVDVIAERIANRLVETPPVDAAGNPLPVTPEAIENVVRSAWQGEETARRERRRARTQESIERRVGEYATQLAWNSAETASVQQILNESWAARNELRARVEDGELAWDEAREQRQSMRDEEETRLNEALGEDRAAELESLRDQERGRGRRGR